MKKLLLLVCIIVAATGAYAQPDSLWSRTFGGSRSDLCYSVQQTTDGGYILGGRTYSFGSGERDFWLVKTDLTGTEEWNRTFGGSSWDECNSVQQTSDGGYVLGGYTQSYGVGDYDFWLVKTDANGDSLWSRTFGGSSRDECMSVRQTSDGGYILGGHTWSFGAGNYDSWLVKTDASGTEEWSRTLGGSNGDYCASVQQTSDGGYVLGGYTQSYGVGDYDFWLVKTDANGDSLWSRTFGGSRDDRCYSVQQTSDGGYILGGYTWSFGAGNYDSWLVKTDASGTEEWSRTLGGSSSDECYSVQQTSDGGYILGGCTYSYGVGSSAFWLVKTDAYGDSLWSCTFGGSSSGVCYSVQQTTDGGYILGGYTWVSDFDFWLVKTGPDPHYQTLNVSSPNGGETWQANEPHNITWNSGSLVGNVQIHLYRGGILPPNFYQPIAAGEPNNGLFVWTISTSIPSSSDYYIGIADVDDEPWDYSNGPFTIIVPSLQLTHPNGGEFYWWNQPMDITWTTTGDVPSVNLALFRGDPLHGTYFMTVAENLLNSGSYEWSVPLSVGFGSQYYVHVESADGYPDDYSDVPFEIGNPCSDGEVSGYVKNPNGTLVSGATVTVQRTDVPNTPRIVQTDAAGEFAFSNLSPGTYNLQATHPDYLDALQSLSLQCQGEQQSARWRNPLPLLWKRDLFIESVEAYQTVKFTQPDPLIAGKATVVIAEIGNQGSVFAGRTQVAGWVTVITADEHGDNESSEIRCIPEDGFNWHPTGHYSNSEKESWEDALYFIVPASYLPPSTNTRFRVELDAPNDPAEGNTWTTDSYEFVASQPAEIRLVRLVVQGQGPSSAYCRALKDVLETRLEAMFPFTSSTFNIEVHPCVYEFPNRPPEDDTVRTESYLRLAELANNEPNNFFIGVYPAAHLGSGMRLGEAKGCAETHKESKYRTMLVCDPGPYNTSSPLSLFPVRAAHELGHSLGCVLFPNRELYAECVHPPDDPSGLCALDVWGLNTDWQLQGCTGDRRGKKPNNLDVCGDVMGWANSCDHWVRWDHTYSDFKEKAVNYQPIASVRLTRDQGDYCVVQGIVNSDSTVRLFQVTTFQGEYTDAILDSGSYRLRWYDFDGLTVIKELWFDLTFDILGEPTTSDIFYFVTSRPDSSGSVTLSLGDYEMASVTASGNEPWVSLASPVGGEFLQDSVFIRWAASDADGDSLQFDVYANRNGGNWEPIAMGVRDTFSVWHVKDFPGTNAGRVKVTVSDGWHSASDSSDGTFTIAVHNPVVQIESPHDTAIVLVTSHISLSGRASDIEDGNIPSESLFWFDETDSLGSGNLIQIDSLSAGLHMITLKAIDHDGNPGHAMVYVNVLRDNDTDGMDDGWEAMHGLDTTRNDAYADFDRDHLTNVQEYKLGTLPDDADTDNDGYSDDEEIAGGSDPLDVSSIPTIMWLTSPTALSPLGSLGFNESLILTWSASSANDSLRPIRYEVYLDADSTFSNPLILYADTLLSTAAPWQLSVGLTYSWKVKATDLYGHWVWSNALEFTRRANPQVPARISNLTIIKTNSGLQLDWSPVTADTNGNPITVGLYVISASPALDGPYLPIAFSTEISWTDTEVERLEWPTWFYVVEGNTNYNPPQLFSRRNWPVQIRGIHQSRE